MAEKGKDRAPRKTPYGTLLTELRYKSGLTIREFAAKAGIKHSTLSQLERGFRNPPSKPSTVEKFYQKLSNISQVTENDVSLLKALGGRRAPKEFYWKSIFFPIEGVMLSIHPSSANFSDDEIEIFRREVILTARDILRRREERANRLGISPHEL